MAVPRRFVTAGVLAVAGLGCAAGAGRTSDGAARKPGVGGSENRAVAATPVFSVRRAPELLARFVAQRRLDREVDGALAGTHACLVARSGELTIERRDAGQPLAAASSQKLLIGAAALKVLGADFRFETRVVAKSEPRQGEVGDVWLVGAGDPLLATPEYQAFLATLKLARDRPVTPLVALADTLAAAGVRAIHGAVHGDDDRYDRTRYLPTWKPVYVSDHEIGPLGALTVNDGFSAWRPKTIAAADPAASAAAELSRLAVARGITVDAPAGAQSAPSGTVTLARIRSAPLHDVVADMISESNNLTAELLVRELGKKVAGEGTTAAGLAVVSGELARLDLPIDGLQLSDGSGLDTNNRVTCDLLVQAVELGERDQYRALRDGLAVAGRSGTLVTRLIGTPLEGRLRAKTGSIAGVVGLTGFIDANRRVVFSLVANGPFGDRDGRTIQDRIALALSRWPDGPDPAALEPSVP